VIPLPDPPLRSGQLVLRPWHLDDAPALVAAWADEEVRRWTAVPDARDLAAAERWIAGDAIRRARDLSLDLVVDRHGEVVGEVGLATFDRAGNTVEIGWWTAAAHRGQGVATAAATTLTEWAASHFGVAVVARCHPDNLAAIAVARRAGAMVPS
jgi:RimJ/RimL family protein N-acetyltransferase